ncbi:MAG: patatin-like phospholipase family protein [Hyphomonadaceae bacterium JAD_PAG50586_4]|nr:MAG: patatin-like phospholipase family protein [Hyphomonadaceae bacterium JAD_PAG50586_4]
MASSTLAVGWAALRFDTNGVATNFQDAIVLPLMRFCREHTIDLPSFVRGIGPFSSAPRELARSYRRILGAATLADLPEPGPGVPEFIFNTTNMEQNTRFSFSKREAYDRSVGTICSPRFPLTEVIAASSAFPPIFAPFEFDMGQDDWAPGHQWADDVDASYRGRIALADGGIYDNMGLEPIWKERSILLVSNAGDPFPDDDTPPHQWFSQMRRVIRMMHRQAENNRKRWLIERSRPDITSAAYRQHVALWQIEGSARSYNPPGGAAPVAPGASDAAKHEVRLKALEFDEAEALFQHGYSMADAAVRTWWPAMREKSPPSALPRCPV